MGMVTVSARLPPPFASLPAIAASIRAGCSLSSPSPSPSRRRCRQVLPRRRLRPLGISVSRFGNFTSKRSGSNADVVLDHLATVDEIPEEHPSLQPDCSLPIVHLTSDVLDSKSLNLLNEESYINSIFVELPVLSEEEQDALAATPAHPSGLYGGVP